MAWKSPTMGGFQTKHWSLVFPNLLFLCFGKKKKKRQREKKKRKMKETDGCVCWKNVDSWFFLILVIVDSQKMSIKTFVDGKKTLIKPLSTKLERQQKWFSWRLKNVNKDSYCTSPCCSKKRKEKIVMLSNPAISIALKKKEKVYIICIINYLFNDK